MLARILRLRPFLWPVPVVLAGYIASIWFELGITYDDGGLGGVTILVVHTLGVVGWWCAQLLFSLLNEPIVNTTVTVILLFPPVAAAGCLPYFVLDRLSQRWLQKRLSDGSADAKVG